VAAARAEAAALPDPEMRARLERAVALLEQRPRLTAQTGPAELRQEQARLRGYQRDELSWLVDTRDRLAQGGLRRSERRRLQVAIGEREQALAQLGRRLGDVDQRLADLDAKRAAQTAWDRDHAEPLGEALIFGRELSHRELAEAVQLEQDPPGHLVAELGGRPDTAAGRAAWRAAAVGIQTYRASHDIDDPASALGPAPTDPAAHLEWTAAARLTQAAAQASRASKAPAYPSRTPTSSATSPCRRHREVPHAQPFHLRQRLSLAAVPDGCPGQPGRPPGPVRRVGSSAPSRCPDASQVGGVPRAYALAAKPVARPISRSLRPHPPVEASHYRPGRRPSRP